MLRSMTGFGRGEAIGQGRKFTVELKAVNHRFSEVVLRLPRPMSPLEERARRYIQARISRGRIDGYFSVEECGEKTPTVKVDKALASSYYKAMKELQEELGIAGDIKLKHLIGLPNVFLLEEPQEDIELWWPVVEEALARAVIGLLDMRESEGARLKVDLQKRIDIIAEITKTIEQHAPLVVDEYRERLTQRLQEWLNDGVLDSARIAAEAAIFAERSNITEEVVRLYSHIIQVKATLEKDEPVGRKLDFLVQEMNREINTIASKSNNLGISKAAVDVKSELEKIREQVQNIE